MTTTMTFVTLDLETTGLNPETDTIIEIAAIKFDIFFDGKNFEIQNPIERTMLVNPNIPLSEEVTLITHITDSMLAGKPQWNDIKQKVADFIPADAVILGHNVFFDIAMFQTHGIDLTNHKIIDTFELSEILSQKAKSLNLGFLADFYGIKKRGAEHRALTDTWITTDIFVKFLQEINSLNDLQKEIWEKFALETNSPIYFLKKFFKKSTTETTYFENFFKNLQTTQTENIFPEKEIQENSEKKLEIFSLEIDEKSENQENIECDFITNIQKKSDNIEIICNTKKSAELLLKNLKKSHHNAIIESEKYHFVAVDEVLEAIQNTQNSERKYFIFLLKMIFWLTETKTWLLSELKYYGNEFDWTEKFRLQNNEENFFWKNEQNTAKNTSILVKVFQKNFAQNPLRKTIFRDIALTENTIRKMLSTEISFEKIIKNLEIFEKTEKIIEIIRTIEAIYSRASNRPTGENPIPPGKYGETYFIPQQEFWCRSFKWLSLATKNLISEWKIFEKNIQINSRFEKIIFQKISEEIRAMKSFHIVKNPDIGVIITIVNDEICAQYIDKNITKKSEKFFQNAIGYGFGLTSENMEIFLKNEFPNVEKIEIFWKKWEQMTNFEDPKTALQWEKILILTTSMKHIREIGNSINKDEFRVLMQGISGGKSKMKHYFLENSEKKSVLIGLIDTFREEFEILEKLDTVIIAKIPFDPPTDPHFLAKTVWMSNSFEIYSKPVVLSKLNSLIGNIKIMNEKTKIICTDNRIQTTEWGKFVGKNIL